MRTQEGVQQRRGASPYGCVWSLTREAVASASYFRRGELRAQQPLDDADNVFGPGGFVHAKGRPSLAPPQIYHALLQSGQEEDRRIF